MKLDEQPIIHPGLMQHIGNRYPSLCNIEHKTVTQDELGQETIVYQPDELLRAIFCYVQPASGIETRSRQEVLNVNQWVIGLRGYYPTILVSDQAMVDDIAYDVIRVAHDDHHTATYLTCEIVDNG